MGDMIVYDQENFNNELRNITNMGSNMVGLLRTEQAPGRSFLSVQKQFELLQRICNTIDNYQAFLERDIARCEAFGEAYFNADEAIRRELEASGQV